MNGKKAKALRRLVWKGKGNPPGAAELKESGKPFSTEKAMVLKCWGPREQYLKAKKARKNG
jgi:hypothetical protein